MIQIGGAIWFMMEISKPFNNEFLRLFDQWYNRDDRQLYPVAVIIIIVVGLFITLFLIILQKPKYLKLCMWLK